MIVIFVLLILDTAWDQVSIPAAAWAALVGFWILYKAVLESRQPLSKSADKSEFSEMDWLVSATKDGVYSSIDGRWQILSYDNDKFMLAGEDDQFVILTATKLTAAMDQAEVLIKALTPEE